MHKGVTAPTLKHASFISLFALSAPIIHQFLFLTSKYRKILVNNRNLSFWWDMIFPNLGPYLRDFRSINPYPKRLAYKPISNHIVFPSHVAEKMLVFTPTSDDVPCLLHQLYKFRLPRPCSLLHKLDDQGAIPCQHHVLARVLRQHRINKLNTFQHGFGLSHVVSRGIFPKI